MSRIEESFRLRRSIERGEPQPTARYRVRAGGCPGEEALRALRAGLGSLAGVTPVHAAVVAGVLLRIEEVAPGGLPNNSAR